MFILRNALSARQRRQLRAQCSACKSVIYRFEAWCPFCLARNAQFSEAIFAQRARCSVDEARRICALDPEHRFERLQYEGFARTRPRLPPLRGCALCGRALQ